MADPVIGDSQIKSNDLIVSFVQQKLIEASVLAGALTNVSQYAVGGLKSLEFPIASQFVVKKKTTGVATDSQLLTYTTDALDLNQHYYVKWIIENKALLQSAVGLDADAMENAALSLAEKFDKDLYDALIAGAAVANNVAYTGAGTTLAQADIVSARQKIKASKVRNFAGNLFLAVNSSDEASMLKLADFIDASKYGTNAPIMNGEIGQALGVKILCTESVAAGKPVMFHKEALYFGFQKNPTVMSQDDLENLGKKWVIDSLGGFKAMRSGILISALNP
jgi:hypothetical protein